jgi:hypothetical protein
VEIVQRDDVIPIPQKPFAQMRPQEARASGNQGATSFLVGLPLTASGSQFQNLDDLAHAFPLRNAHATAEPGQTVRPRLQNVTNLRISGFANIDVR